MYFFAAAIAVCIVLYSNILCGACPALVSISASGSMFRPGSVMSPSVQIPALI